MFLLKIFKNGSKIHFTIKITKKCFLCYTKFSPFAKKLPRVQFHAPDVLIIIDSRKCFKKETLCKFTFQQDIGLGLDYLSGGVLSSNSAETAWTFPAPFYRINIDSPRIVYVYFHRPIYHRDFSMTVFLKVIYGQDKLTL